MALSEALQKEITAMVARQRVVLFMKGSRLQPQCGFSAQVVQILDGLRSSYETVDVLRSLELREGIKVFSDWPTLPQLYIDGKFIGGCDIVREMHASGELARLLGAPSALPPVPTITLSDAASHALTAAAAESAGEPLRLKIDAQFQHELFFGPRASDDVDVNAGAHTLVLDAASARRAEGVGIDYVAGPNGGFKIDNPNQPPRVKPLVATDMKSMLDRGELILFDVRPESERALAKISAARSLDAAGQAFLDGLDRATAIAFHCHHGIRSEKAAAQWLQQGFRKVYNLRGGIDAWSQLVDPSVPRY